MAAAPADRAVAVAAGLEEAASAAAGGRPGLRNDALLDIVLDLVVAVRVRAAMVSARAASPWRWRATRSSASR